MQMPEYMYIWNCCLVLLFGSGKVWKMFWDTRYLNPWNRNQFYNPGIDFKLVVGLRFGWICQINRIHMNRFPNGDYDYIKWWRNYSFTRCADANARSSPRSCACCEPANPTELDWCSLNAVTKHQKVADRLVCRSRATIEQRSPSWMKRSNILNNRIPSTWECDIMCRTTYLVTDAWGWAFKQMDKCSEHVRSCSEREPWNKNK